MSLLLKLKIIEEHLAEQLKNQPKNIKNYLVYNKYGTNKGNNTVAK